MRGCSNKQQTRREASDSECIKCAHHRHAETVWRWTGPGRPVASSARTSVPELPSARPSAARAAQSQSALRMLCSTKARTVSTRGDKTFTQTRVKPQTDPNSTRTLFPLSTGKFSNAEIRTCAWCAGVAVTQRLQCRAMGQLVAQRRQDVGGASRDGARANQLRHGSGWWCRLGQTPDLRSEYPLPMGTKSPAKHRSVFCHAHTGAHYTLQHSPYICLLPFGGSHFTTSSAKNVGRSASTRTHKQTHTHIHNSDSHSTRTTAVSVLRERVIKCQSPPPRQHTRVT